MFCSPATTRPCSHLWLAREDLETKLSLGWLSEPGKPAAPTNGITVDAQEHPVTIDRLAVLTMLHTFVLIWAARGLLHTHHQSFRGGARPFVLLGDTGRANRSCPNELRLPTKKAIFLFFLRLLVPLRLLPPRSSSLEFIRLSARFPRCLTG